MTGKELLKELQKLSEDELEAEVFMITERGNRLSYILIDRHPELVAAKPFKPAIILK